MSDGGGTRGERWRSIRRWAIIALVLVVIVLVAVPFAHRLFPIETQASCTLTSGSERDHRYRGGPDLFPRIGTDCGSFTADEEVACTADPSRTVRMLAGVTFDLRVQGPRIPVFSNPTVVTAQVSSVQLVQPPDLRDDSIPDNENLRKLRESISPAHYRAWDYEQPPYDRQCDAFRTVMTSEGVQIMTIPQADQTLEVPEGVVPVSPLLPCDDWYYCEEH